MRDLGRGRRLATGLAGCTAAILIAPAAVRAQEITEIRRLGTGNSFCGFTIDTTTELESFLEQYRGDIDYVFRNAGLPIDAGAILTAVAEGGAREVRVPVGTELRWMAVRRERRPTLVERVRWAGTEPFEAFEVTVGSECTEARLLIPKSCGNVALLSAQTGAPPSPPGLGVRQSGRCAGERVTADVVPRRAEDEVELTISRPEGLVQLVALEPTESGLRWTASITDPGSYTFRVSARNSCGVSEPVVQEIELEPCVPTCAIRVVPPSDAEPGSSTLLVEVFGAAEAGEVAFANVDVYRGDELVDRLDMSEAPFRARWVVPAFDSYRLIGEVRDARGVTSLDECSAAFVLAEPVRSPIGPLVSLFGGLERRWRPVEGVPMDQIVDRSAPLAGGAGGLLVRFSPHLGVFAQLGGALNLEETDHSSVFGDGGLDVFIGSGFLGAGIGYWDFNHEETRDVTFVAHGGVDTPWTLGGLRVQWFVEGRLFRDTLDEIDDNYVAVTGFRFVRRE